MGSKTKTIPAEHRKHCFHFCDTPNEKSPVLKNGPFRPRGVAKIEKMSATLGEKQPKKRDPCGAQESFFSLLRHP